VLPVLAGVVVLDRGKLFGRHACLRRRDEARVELELARARFGWRKELFALEEAREPRIGDAEALATPIEEREAAGGPEVLSLAGVSFPVSRRPAAETR
jgi:hypothetical protein